MRAEVMRVTSMKTLKAHVQSAFLPSLVTVEEHTEMAPSIWDLNHGKHPLPADLSWACPVGTK